MVVGCDVGRTLGVTVVVGFDVCLSLCLRGFGLRLGDGGRGS